MIANFGQELLTILLGFGAVAVFGAILQQEVQPKARGTDSKTAIPKVQAKQTVTPPKEKTLPPSVPLPQTAPTFVAPATLKVEPQQVAPPTEKILPAPAPQPQIAKPVFVSLKTPIPAIPKPVIVSPLEEAIQQQAEAAESAKRKTPEEREALRAARAERQAKREQRLQAQPEIPELIAEDAPDDQAERLKRKTPEDREALRAARAEKLAKREERMRKLAERKRQSEDQSA